MNMYSLLENNFDLARELVEQTMLLLRSTGPYSFMAHCQRHLQHRQEYSIPQTPQFDRPQSKRQGSGAKCIVVRGL